MSSEGMANVVVVALLALTAPVVFALEVESTGVRHAAMVRAVEVDIRQASGETGKPELSPQVLKALAEAPRREFVPVNERDHAYENRPLPIGYGQTISQPTIVALMTELLDVKKEDVVLEVGTGSGYQAAVLAECAKQVYSIEIIEELGKSALERLNRLGIRNVQVRVGDGYHGWEEHAPYDGIVVTAAGSHIPPPLVRQLKPGGGRGFASASGTQAMAGRVTLQARA